MIRIRTRIHRLRTGGRPVVPNLVPFADREARALVETSPPGRVLLGLTAGDRAVYLDLDGTDSSIAVHSGAGGGTSSILRSLAAQAVHAGATATVIDLRRHGQAWAKDLPGVEHLADIAATHARLVALGDEALAWATDSSLVADHGLHRRHVVVLDDATNTLHQLRHWWNVNRTPQDHLRSPALVAIEDLLFMGRATRTSVLFGAFPYLPSHTLRVEARAVPTPILGRLGPIHWRLITGQQPPATTSIRPGRVHLARPSGEVIETQALYVTDHEARQLATSATTEPEAAR